MLLGKGRYGAELNRVSLSVRNRKEKKIRRRDGAAPQATRGKPNTIHYLSHSQREKTRGLLVPTVDGTYKLRLTMSKKKINKRISTMSKKKINKRISTNNQNNENNKKTNIKRN